MNPFSFDHIPPFYDKNPDEPHGVNVSVETPRGTRNKFAYKEEYGVIELRRILRGGMTWPCDFGFPAANSGRRRRRHRHGAAHRRAVFSRMSGARASTRSSTPEEKRPAERPSHRLPDFTARCRLDVDEMRELADVSPRLLRELEGFLKDYQTFEGNVIELDGFIDRADSDAKRARSTSHVARAQFLTTSPLPNIQPLI
jgi:inorganic pyrophosphatase